MINPRDFENIDNLPEEFLQEMSNNGDSSQDPEIIEVYEPDDSSIDSDTGIASKYVSIKDYRKMKELEAENRKLRRTVAFLSDIQSTLERVLSGNFTDEELKLIRERVANVDISN